MVGADGIFSQLRKEVTKRQQNKNFALEAYIDKKDTPLQIHFLNHFKGYAWMIPNGKNTILGIGDVYGNVHLKDEFITLFHLNEEKIKGAFLPTGDDILLERNGVYFIGDAAGLIAPITGEGIYYALLSAYQLSKNSNTMLYQKKMKKEIRTTKKILKTKKLVYNDTLRAFLFKKYNQSKVINKCINAFVQKIL